MGINKEKYFNYVKEFFKKNECELLTLFENFTNNKDNNLKFLCKCGNIQHNINFKWYSRSIHKLCKKCSLNNNSRRSKEFDNMLNYFKKYGCKLLTQKSDYINNLTKNLSYICKCNKIVENESYQLYYLSTYKCCQECKKIKMNHRYRPFDDVKKLFIDNNVKLLTEEKDYKGANVTKLSYLCECGDTVNDILYHSFELCKYKRCKKCVKKLIKKTNLQKYGYEIPMHHPEILNNTIKKQYNLKDFIFPSGNIIKVQGYEDLALKILIENKYDEKDIITNRLMIPTFEYFFKNKNKKYLPDIYIKSENKIIEVKSSRTFEIMKIQNILKALSVRKAGYDFEFWIFYKVLKDDKPNYQYKKGILKLFKL